MKQRKWLKGDLKPARENNKQDQHHENIPI